MIAGKILDHYSRDGHSNFDQITLSIVVVPQSKTQKEVKENVFDKLKVVRAREYITCGIDVKSLTPVFPLAKT